MPIRKLAHFSIRTSRLEESKRFYVEILGLRVGYRPPLDFPGVWLYQGGDEADYGVVHLIGTDGDGRGLVDYLGEKADAGTGTGALDHLAFLATELDEFRHRLQRHKIEFFERTVPALRLRQMFFSDPSGLTIEMNFPATDTQAAPEGVAPAASTEHSST